MSTPNQKLVLYFDPNHIPTHQKVRNCLQKLSPGRADRIDTLLKSGRVILKRNADPEKDHRIVELLAQAGGVCRFETVKNIAAKANTEPLRSREMVCPKCNRTQIRAPECSYCGLIVEKFQKRTLRPRPSEPVSPPPLKQVDKPTPSNPRLLDTLKKRYSPAIGKIWNWMKGNPLSGEMIQQWSKRLADAVFRCIVVFLVALALNIGLLFFARTIWFIYTSTAVGQVYLSKFANEASGILQLMHSNPALAGWQASITVLVICVLVGIVAQWFHLIRFFYLPFGFMGHTLLWVLPLTGLSAWHLYHEGFTNQMGISCALTFLPSLLLLPCCIHLVQTAVPEMGTMMRIGRGVTGGLDNHIYQLKRQIKTWWDTLMKS